MTGASGSDSGGDDSPSVGCRFRQRVASEKLACEAFSMYAHRESRARWLSAPRVPTHARFLAIDAGKERPKAGSPLRRKHALHIALDVPG